MDAAHMDTDSGGPRRWVLVAAVARNGVIGRGGALPWRLRSDLQRFKRMTMGHCLLMGRKTFESIGRPLPGRQTIVLSRHPRPSDWPPEIQVVSEMEAVEHWAEPGRDIMVVGGAQVYAAAMDVCDTMWLTRVDADVPGDVFFPPVDWERWHLRSQESVTAGPRDQWPSEFQIWTRKHHLRQS
ncbi:MAG: dihydrofolate reductase [Planctomycetota bacterium]|nr:MAG: dihydrofolate reductase [Planctomycetota bacterium]